MDWCGIVFLAIKVGEAVVFSTHGPWNQVLSACVREKLPLEVEIKVSNSTHLITIKGTKNGNWVEVKGETHSGKLLAESNAKGGTILEVIAPLLSSEIFT